MHWSKFSDAIRDLEDTTGFAFKNSSKIYNFENVCTHVAEQIKNAQRFYLPDAANVLKDNQILDKSLLDMVYLPFPVIAILSEHKMYTEDGTSLVDGWAMTVAIAPEDPKIRKILFWSVMKRVGEGWNLLPVPAILFLFDEGYSLQYYQTTNEEKGFLEELKEIYKARDQDVIDAVSKDVSSIVNLCVLLGTKDAATHQVEAPPKLNKARVKNGKQPLPDYHVLKIGGEVWDTQYTKTRDAHGGVRSHLRRGHIRRLHITEKPVWVRATVVHGSVEGFVKKDYKIDAHL